MSTSPKTNAPINVLADLPPTAGGAMTALAGMKRQLATGAMHMVQHHPQYADDCVAALAAAKRKKGASVRDAMLGVYWKTPEGEYKEATKREHMLVAPKLRTQAVKDWLAEYKLLENNINVQGKRIADTRSGVNILTAAGFTVSLRKIDGTSTWVCYFRNEAGADEKDNQKIGVEHLVALANMPKHGIVKSTTAVQVLAKLSSKRKAGKKKGEAQTNPAADMVKGHTVDVLNALDTRLAALTDVDKKLIDGVSPATRAAFHRLFVRLSIAISDDDKVAAFATFNADAAATPPPVSRKKKRAA